MDIGGGAVCSLPGAYTYLPCGGQPCQISALAPATGEVGDPVTITGSRFEAGAQVYFGDLPEVAQATVIDESGVPNTLVVLAPARVGGDPVL